GSQETAQFSSPHAPSYKPAAPFWWAGTTEESDPQRVSRSGLSTSHADRSSRQEVVLIAILHRPTSLHVGPGTLRIPAVFSGGVRTNLRRLTCQEHPPGEDRRFQHPPQRGNLWRRLRPATRGRGDRKSTRLKSSHQITSYA